MDVITWAILHNKIKRLTASDIRYDNTSSTGLVSDNVKDAIDELSRRGGFRNVIVEELPPIGEGGVCYYVPKETSEVENIYEEYIWLDDIEDFEKIGDTAVDLTDYVKEEELHPVAKSGDYNDLENKLIVVANPDNQAEFDLNKIQIANHYYNLDVIHVNTENFWNSQVGLISKAGHVYVYKDHSRNGNQEIPAVKIGDGLAYLIDLPFVESNFTELTNHINNNQIHITQAERNFWNNKVRCDDGILIQDGETLIFTIN